MTEFVVVKKLSAEGEKEWYRYLRSYSFADPLEPHIIEWISEHPEYMEEKLEIVE